MLQFIRWAAFVIGCFALYCDLRALLILVARHRHGLPPDLAYWLALAAASAVLALSMALAYRKEKDKH
jgi:hypothetical protein